MKLTASGALKQREDSMKLGGFSKMWKVGDQGIVYYPVIRDEETGRLDLLVAAVWGHPVDMQQLGLKVTFIPTHSEINDRGEPVTPDITYQFSRIARLFTEGEKEERKQRVMAKDWTGQPPAAQAKALQDIEDEYDTKTNMKAKKAAVQRLTLLITTECLYVPVENDVPQPDKARLVSQSLSNDRIAKLLALLNNSMFKPNYDAGENWLEVSYTFTSSRNDKGEAGRADPQGISSEMKLSRRYPEAFNAIQGRLSGLPKDSSTIERRNYSYREVSEGAIKQALSTFCVVNQDNLSYLTEEGEEILVKNASVVDTLRIKVQKPELREMIDSAIAEMATENTDSGTPNLDSYVAGGAPTIESLMNHQARPDDNTANEADDSEGAENVAL